MNKKKEGKDLFGGKSPCASRRQEISTEKDAADNEFEDRPRPTSNNLKDHWPKIIYCNFILFLVNNLNQLKKDENGIDVYSKNEASSNLKWKAKCLMILKLHQICMMFLNGSKDDLTPPPPPPRPAKYDASET